MSTTRADRERALRIVLPCAYTEGQERWAHDGDEGYLVWSSGEPMSDNTVTRLRTAALECAAHREAAVAAERERVVAYLSSPVFTRNVNVAGGDIKRGEHAKAMK